MAKKKDTLKAPEVKEEKKPIAEVVKAVKEEKPAVKKDVKAPKPVPSVAPAGYKWVKVTQDQVMDLQKKHKLAGFWPPTMEALIKDEEE